MKSLNHNRIAAILLTAAAILGTSSCSNSENDSTEFIGTTKVSIPISGESFGEDVATRSATTASATVSSAVDLGGGVIMEASITPERSSAQSRTANVITSGTVLVAVYDGTTLYRTIPSATISNGIISNIEVPIGKPIKLVFYADYDDASQTCTAPTVSGETITSTDNGSGTIDLMRGEIPSVTITENTTTLDGFTFKHLYSRAKVTYTVNFGNIDSPIITSINKDAFSSGATVALSDGTVTAGTTNISEMLSFDNAPSSTTNTSSTSYKYFIANKDASSLGLICMSDQALNSDMNVGLADILTLAGHFKNGTSYDVKIAINWHAYLINFDSNNGTPGSTTSQAKDYGYNINLKTTANPTRDGYTFVGWTLDKTKTAAIYIIPGGATISDATIKKDVYSADPVTLYAVWAKKYDTTTYAYTNSSAYSGCPSEAEAEKYVGAGIYWDSTALWSDMSGNVSRGGIWLMRTANIPSGTTPTSTGNATAGTPTNIDNYFFLPVSNGSDANYWLNDGSSLLVNKDATHSILLVPTFVNDTNTLMIWGAQ